MRRWQVALFILVSCVVVTSCMVVKFPDRPSHQIAADGAAAERAYDMNEDGQIDYRQMLDEAGQVIELGFVDRTSGHTQFINIIDSVEADTPHIIIALDGVPFEVVENLYEQGHFRLFYRPVRMVSCFPGLTDLAYAKIFGTARPLAFEAKYYDPEQNKVLGGGSDVYLSGANAAWAQQLDYRCSFFWDGLAYVNPQMVFEHELEGMSKAIRNSQSPTTMVYSVATAGLGTRGGRDAIQKYLREIDRFCEQIVYERRGKVKITLLADHGQNMAGKVNDSRIVFKDLLEQEGYRVRNSIEDQRDVVVPEYGLITAAYMHTQDPAGVAQVLLSDPRVELACYRDADQIVVQSINGRALISYENGFYRYDAQQGDPLQLAPVLALLQSTEPVIEDIAGPHEDLYGAMQAEQAEQESPRPLWIEDRVLLEATATHVYPDPLKRIWEAFDNLAERTPDVIVSIRDGYYHGDAMFHNAIGGAASTHGALNRINSNTFVMTMWGELPPILRLEDAFAQVELAQMRATAGPGETPNK